MGGLPDGRYRRELSFSLQCVKSALALLHKYNYTFGFPLILAEINRRLLAAPSGVMG